MFELTYKLLSEYMTEERFALFLKGTDLLVQYGLEDTLEQMEQYIMSKEENETSILVAAVQDMMIEGLKSIIKRFSIELEDEVDIELLNQVLIGLVMIEETEMKETIWMILDSDVSNEEKLSDILSITTALDSVEYQMIFKEVGDDLIKRTKEKLKFQLEEIPDEINEESLITHRNIINKVKEAIKVINNDHLFVVELLRSTPKLGLSFELYLTLFLESIMENENIKEVTQNLYLLALMSEEGYLNPVETIKTHLEVIEPDLVHSTQILDEARKLSMSISGLNSSFNQK